MYLKTLVVCVLVTISAVNCRPQQPAAPDGSSTTPIPIISHDEVVGENGAFNYTYETGNGIKTQVSGYTKPPIANRIAGGPDDEGPQPIQVLSGSYSYQAPDGTQISLTYIADENGFQPEGAHLPTAPPIPQGIQAVLDGIQQAQGQQVGAVRTAGGPAPVPVPAPAGIAGDSAAAASIPNIEILRP